MALPSELFESSGLVLLFDSIVYPARPFSRLFLHKWVARSQQRTEGGRGAEAEKPWGTTLAILFEDPPKAFLEDPHVTLTGGGFLGFLDCQSDPLGWEKTLPASLAVPSADGGETLVTQCHKAFELEGLVAQVDRLLEGQNTPGNLYIDSLTPFLLRNGGLNTSLLLNRLLQLRTAAGVPKVQRILTTFHEDVISHYPGGDKERTVSGSHLLERLSYLATLILQTAPPPLTINELSLSSTLAGANLLPFPSSEGQLHVLQRRPSGKVIRLIKDYRIDTKGNVSLLSAHRGSGKTSAAASAAAASLPPELASAMTTFNLGSTEKQKKARKEVELPYMQRQKSEGTGGGGIIYLEPTDEEYESDDPDDDLEI